MKFFLLFRAVENLFPNNCIFFFRINTNIEKKEKNTLLLNTLKISIRSINLSFLVTIKISETNSMPETCTLLHDSIDFHYFLKSNMAAVAAINLLSKVHVSVSHYEKKKNTSPVQPKKKK